ncbi:NXPE family member 4-like [Mya arenaria]|uniref:NXPE family member 4-like n=1 Tax=Mya arenaria TaxID=6604 RepID=UPI0022E0B4C4|nr:NXPE family member 4-like [Mya arenaria]
MARKSEDANTVCGSSSELSSGLYSNLSLLSHNIHTNELHVLIRLYDVTGRPKSRGGDVVTVRALRLPSSGSMNTKTEEPVAVVAGTVTDNGDGTYVATVKVFWSGPTEIRAIIASQYANSCRRFLAMELYGDSVYSLKSPYGVWVIFQETNFTESTPCSAVPNVVGYDKICNLTKHNFNMTIYCGQPKSRQLSCRSPIVLWTPRKFDVLKRNDSGIIFRPLVAELKNTIVLNISASCSNTNRYFAGEKSVYNFELNQTECKIRSALFSWNETYPTGLGVNHGWRMLHCRHTQVRDTATIRRCFAGKRFYVMGDSTVRQYFENIISKLNSSNHIRKNVNGLLFTDPRQNMHFEWSIHSMPYHCGGSVAKCVSSSIAGKLWDILYKRSLSIDGSEIIILITMNTHLQKYPLEVLRRRLRSLVKPITMLKAKYPLSKVLFKGPHQCSQDDKWFDVRIALMYREIIYEELNSILDKVIYLDTFSISVAYGSIMLHPEGQTLDAQIDQFLAYVC